MYNNSLKPTVTRVTPFAHKAKPAPRYGGLVPPIGPTLRAGLSFRRLYPSACQAAQAQPIMRIEPTRMRPSKLDHPRGSPAGPLYVQD